MSTLTDRPEWTALADAHAQLSGTHLRQLFAEDPERGPSMTHEVGDLVVDLSKHRVTHEVLDRLVALAEACGVDQRLQSMMAGERINTTEDRAVLHTALRTPADQQVLVDGHDVVPDVHAVLDQMAAFTDRVRSGAWRGFDDRPITTIVNIGIGGSDLGPAMAARALSAHIDRDLRFVSNVDAAALDRTLATCDPGTTLFVVASKTFTTIETLTNARSARRWLVDAAGEDAVARHFVAVSTNVEGVTDFGIDPANMFAFWDWVGGRYSLCSAIGLSLMLGLGADGFRDMLSGFHLVDRHAATAPLGQNVPVLMALIGIWYRNFGDLPTLAVLPYSEDLARFPAYLQQLDMESLGKRVAADGQPVDVQTGAVVWGEPGTNGQHAFFQLLHQGTATVPCDFIGVLRPDADLADARVHDDQLVANLIAQTRALAFGKSAEEVAADGVASDLVPHRTFPGDVPSSTILLPSLTPSTLGQLIALYEHKVASQAAVWGINAFDQWGVELGKVLAKEVAAVLDGDQPADFDSSTRGLVQRYRDARWR